MNELIDREATKEQVTLLLSAISYAIKKDHEHQKKAGFKVGRFSLGMYHDLLEKFYPERSNGTMLSVARATAKRIKDNTRTDESVVSAKDAEMLIKMLLINLGSYGWEHTRQAIKGAGPKFKRLLDLSPPPLNAQAKMDQLRIPDQAADGVSLSVMLQRYAAEVAKLEVELDKERKVKAETAESLVDAVNENRKLSQMVTRIRTLISKVDVSNNQQLKNEIESFKHFIESVKV